MHNGGAPDPGNPNRDTELGSGPRLWPDAMIVLDGQRRVTGWFGAARRYAKGRSHRWADVKRNIARGWAGDARP